MSEPPKLACTLNAINSPTATVVDAPAWQQLFEGAAETPASLAPDLALPVLKAVVDDNTVFALRSRVGSTLRGWCLLERQRWRWGLPFVIYHSWQTPLTFSGTPLLADDSSVDEIAQLLAQSHAPLLLQALPCSGFFWQQLSLAAAQINAPMQIITTWERAALRPKTDFDTWFADNFDRKRRKEYRRVRNRLGELGQLESRSWSVGQPIQAWIDNFLGLEAKGWKGRRGTAFAAQAQFTDAMSEALTAFAGRNSLRFWALTLDGQTIATLFAFVCGDTAWLAKITYDENYAKYSPGVLLILDATADLLNHSGIKLVDSCAIPNHPMIDNIWRERITMADVLIGTPGLAPWRFALMLQAELLRRKLREMAKTFFYYLTNRHRS
jgi:CelD/BcsL family acetyltransferase involved in cellulose biosynthesis